MTYSALIAFDKIVIYTLGPKVRGTLKIDARGLKFHMVITIDPYNGMHVHVPKNTWHLCFIPN